MEEGQEPELLPVPDTGRLSLPIIVLVSQGMLLLCVWVALECVTFIFVFILIRDRGVYAIYTLGLCM